MSDILELKDLRFEDILNQPDATNVDSGLQTAPTLNTNVYLTTGRYRFIFSHPLQVISLDSEIYDEITYMNKQGDFVSKGYIIESISVDMINDECSVVINILENLVWAVLIYASVFAIVSIIGAVSTNSVLTKIETIADKPQMYILLIIIGLVSLGMVVKSLK